MTKSAAVDRTYRAVDVYRSLEWATVRLGAVAGKALESFGLTAIQFRVLEMLLREGPMGQTQLGRKLGHGDSNMHFVANTLERRGLVIRRSGAEGGRSTRVRLTPEGQRLAARVFPQHVKLLRALMSPLNRQEQETLRKLCRKVGQGDPVRFLLEMRRGDLEWKS